jgi:hypothetical protein
MPLEGTMDNQKCSYEYGSFQYWILIHTIVLVKPYVCHYLCNGFM